MYNIIQLNDKDLSELQNIAKELGIKNAESMQKVDLVYSILDEQAVANATKKASKDKEKEVDIDKDDEQEDEIDDRAKNEILKDKRKKKESDD